jgi:hypothetical protein
MSDGGMMVTKTVTGVHFIEDIKINVPHQVAVYIPADKALNSKDLHRALSAKIIFQLSSSMFLQQAQTPDYERLRQLALEQENLLLREALARSNQQGVELKSSVTTIEQQMQTLIATLGRIESAPRIVQVTGQPASVVRAPESEVVGGEVPMFIPDNDLPADADVHLEVKQQEGSGDTVSEAQSRLRQLRKGRSG